MVHVISQFCLPHRHRITSQTKAIKRNTKYRNAQRGQRIIDRNHKRWVYRCLKIDIKSALDSTDAPISPVARYGDWKNIIMGQKRWVNTLMVDENTCTCRRQRCEEDKSHRKRALRDRTLCSLA